MTLARELARGFLHLLYPGICASCEQLLPVEQRSFCKPCRTAITTDPFSSCPRCAGTIGPYAHLDEGCSRCRDVSFHFDRVIRLGPYDGLLRDLILRMKHGSGEMLAELLGCLWAEHAEARLREARAEAIVPIPLHWRRHWSRGYNQSEALARSLAERLRVPCQSSWLRRIRFTPQQTQQTRRGRWENVRGAFACRRSASLRGKTVLLVDDVLTTGSTCSEAARVLRQAGARNIIVAVLAHSQR